MGTVAVFENFYCGETNKVRSRKRNNMTTLTYHTRTLVAHLFSCTAGVCFAFGTMVESLGLWVIGLVAAVGGKYLADELAKDLTGNVEL